MEALLRKRLAEHRLSAVAMAALVPLAIWTVTRLCLLWRCGVHADHRPGALVATFATGFAMDLLAASVLALPPLVYLVLLPQRLFRARWHQALLAAVATAATGGLLFGAAAEWLFWEEFEARFNFIAVDYLIYTREVLGNIWESYPLVWILAGIAVGAAAIVRGMTTLGWYARWVGSTTLLRRRLLGGLLCVTVGGVVVVLAALAQPAANSIRNRYNRELAGNGVLSLAVAFRTNQLSYEEYYSTLPGDEALQRAQALVGRVAHAEEPGYPNDILRCIRPAGAEKRWNVIQITVESLSGSYLGIFGNRGGMTPVLDGLADRSLFFTQCYATGTRTVRGMEALTLSVPPTPGCSLVRRPGNENLFSTGALFHERNYDSRFIYSGYGYFDNMNYFFSHNGFSIVDRASGHDAPVTFANIWGACDEDLYTWVIEAADKAFSAGKPFYHFVMTTSNHRPYTFPAGAVDLQQGCRKSAIRYTDYAIGRFLEMAGSKPWFHDTLIVITADHCANSAGDTSIPIGKYHIPLLVYNPELVPARRIDTLCSQIDVAPTLLALLNWSYDSRFYGRDILSTAPEDGRALVSTYQDLGYLKDDTLIVLTPRRREEAFRCDLPTFTMQSTAVDAALRQDCIAYYQSASQLLRLGLLKRLPQSCDHITKY